MSTKILDEGIINQLKGIFDSQLEYPVELILFINHDDCPSCEDTQFILEEISALSDKLIFRTYDLQKHPTQAEKYQINLAPVLAISGREADTILDYGIRFAGIPSGYEFSSLIQDIIMVSKHDSGLRTEIRDELKGLTKPVHLQVFVTPT